MVRYTLGFWFTEDRQHVLLLEKRSGAQAGRLNGVGGKLEGPETYAECMMREAREEVGANPARWELFALMDGPNFEVSCYRAVDDAVLFARAQEEDPCALYAVASLPATCMPNLHWLVPLARDPELAFCVVSYP